MVEGLVKSFISLIAGSVIGSYLNISISNNHRQNWSKPKQVTGNLEQAL